MLQFWLQLHWNLVPMVWLTMCQHWFSLWQAPSPLKWRHNERDGASNHQPHDCLLNRLFRRRSKKTSWLRVTGLYAGNSQVTGEFPAQRASNAENVSIWWLHHALSEPEMASYWSVCTKALTTSIDHSVYAPSQWETALHCNAVSHWLGVCTKWSLNKKTNQALLWWHFVLGNHQ